MHNDGQPESSGAAQRRREQTDSDLETRLRARLTDLGEATLQTYVDRHKQEITEAISPAHSPAPWKLIEHRTSIRVWRGLGPGGRNLERLAYAVAVLCEVDIQRARRFVGCGKQFTPPSQERLNKQLRSAVKGGDAASVRALLNAGADPSHRNSIALMLAVERAHADIVRVLLKDGRADPAADSSRSLRKAAQGDERYTEIVRALLDDGRADPAADAHFSLRTAAYSGQAGIVRALLEDGRADPGALASRALYMAALHGRTEIVHVLLKDGRSDPTTRDGWGLKWAAAKGYREIVCLMISVAPHEQRLGLINDMLETVNLSPRVRAFLLSCKRIPGMFQALDLVQALLQTDLPTQSVIALAFEAARCNMTPQASLHLYAQGVLNSVLRTILGPAREIPSALAIRRQRDLTALSMVSKGEPVLHLGSGPLDIAQYPAILEGLAPTLPAGLTTAIWRTLRAQARGEARPLAYSTPAERVRERMSSHVFLTAAVKEYEAFVADVKGLANENKLLVSSAADDLLLALDELRDAVDSRDAAAVTEAQSRAECRMRTYDERVNRVLGDADAKRAQRFQCVCEIIRMPAEQLTEFARAQARRQIARNARQITL